MEIEHSLPPREQHYAGACTDCHAGSHGVPSSVYRGAGAEGVADDPSVMYEARVTCTGCHRPPFPGAPVPPAGATFRADPLACLDCHGPGFEGMADRWQAETRGTVAQVQANLEELHEALVADVEWEGDPAAAQQFYASAAESLGVVLLDGSEGVHNLPFVRALLRKAADDVAAGLAALDPGMRAKPVHTGPSVISADGCTTLCHVGVEAMIVAPPDALAFDHAAHFTRGGLDCSSCHSAEPHGRTTVAAADCVACHHGNDDSSTCAACHSDTATLLDAQVAGVERPMEGFDCLTCHAGLEAGYSVAAIQENCDFCHEDIEPDFSALRYEPWIEGAWAPLRDLESRLEGAPPQTAATIRDAIEALGRAGPHHNPVFVEAEAARLGALLGPPEAPAEGPAEAGDAAEGNDGQP